MKTALKGRYDVDNNCAVATVVVGAGDVKLSASLRDATVEKGPGMTLAVEKPGFFIVDYDVPKEDLRFQFMNTVQVADKQLNMAYTHCWGKNRTMLEGTLVFDPSNKLAANYLLRSGHCQLKYTYVHKGVTTFEPSYDLSKDTWDFAVSRKVYRDDILKATYQTSSKALGLEYWWNSMPNGCFKVSAALNLDEERKMPKLSAESMWDFDM